LHAFQCGTATTLHEHGIDDKTIQGVLGHSEQRIVVVYRKM
jgi:site-specific recombinase XerD